MQCAGYNLGRILVLFGCLFVGTALGAEETKTNTQTSFEKLVKDSKRIDGLLPLYKKEDKLTIEVPSKLLGKEFFITISKRVFVDPWRDFYSNILSLIYGRNMDGRNMNIRMYI